MKSRDRKDKFFARFGSGARSVVSWTHKVALKREVTLNLVPICPHDATLHAVKRGAQSLARLRHLHPTRRSRPPFLTTSSPRTLQSGSAPSQATAPLDSEIWSRDQLDAADPVIPLPPQPPMLPSLTWLDFTASDRDRMRRVLDLFSERGTVDELGLGSLRDMLSEALFPGTSSIQTRLRYALFVPWIYQDLERRRVSSNEIRARARAAELALIKPLLASNDTSGVIGSSAGSTLRRLPSEAYWTGLVRWGLFLPERSQGWYQKHFDAFTRNSDTDSTPDDPGVTWSKQRSWSPRIPDPPADFPRTVNLALRREEALFLRDQFSARCSGTLLQWLATADAAPTGDFWDEPTVTMASKEVQRTVDLARRFSRHVEGAPILYNLMLAQQRYAMQGDEGDAALIDQHQHDLDTWAAAELVEEPFDAQALWVFAASRGVRVSTPQRTFVEGWTAQVNALGAKGLATDHNTRALLVQRERTLKTTRSRFDNQARLLDWSGGVGLGRMDFRWFRVRQLLTDLHRGLGVT